MAVAITWKRERAGRGERRSSASVDVRDNGRVRIRTLEVAREQTFYIVSDQ